MPRRAALTFGWLLAASGCVAGGPTGAIESPPGNDPTANNGRTAFPGSLCRACSSNDQCGGSGDLCVADVRGPGVCGTACSVDGDCPNGFVCYSVNDASHHPLGKVCLPANDGSCFDSNVSSTGADAGPPANMNGSDAGAVPPGPGPDAGQSQVPHAGPACTTDTWSNEAQSFFSANCNRCHTMYSALAGVETDASRIKADINSGRMPNDHTLSSQDITRITRWMDCDLPQ